MRRTIFQVHQAEARCRIAHTAEENEVERHDEREDQRDPWRPGPKGRGNGRAAGNRRQPDQQTSHRRQQQAVDG